MKNPFTDEHTEDVAARVVAALLIIFVTCIVF